MYSLTTFETTDVFLHKKVECKYVRVKNRQAGHRVFQSLENLPLRTEHDDVMTLRSLSNAEKRRLLFFLAIVRPVSH